MPMYSDDGALIGTPLEILHRKWNEEQIPHEPGVHRVELGKQVNVQCRGVKSKIDIAARIRVRQDSYFGPLRVYTQGFHDAQNSSVIVARELRTDSIDVEAIIRGEVPGWKKLDVTEGTTVRASMRLSVSAGYGDEGDFDDGATEPAALEEGRGADRPDRMSGPHAIQRKRPGDGSEQDPCRHGCRSRVGSNVRDW